MRGKGGIPKVVHLRGRPPKASLEVTLRVRGEYLDWFPPYMKKAPLTHITADPGPGWEHFFHFGDIIKIRTMSITV